jgi:hypothetical protein
MRPAGRWGLAIAISAVAFASSWWVCQECIHLDEGASLGVAGAVLAVVLAVSGWWAGLELPGGANIGPGRRTGQERHVDASTRYRTLAAPTMTSLKVPAGLLPERVLGRGEQVASLARLYSRRGRHMRRVHVFHGMGGCGKTTVALSVAHTLRSRKVEVWWVSASTSADLQAGMRQLAAHLGADVHELDRAWAGMGSAPDLLWRRLQSYRGRWLMVVDGADDPRLLAAAGEYVAGQRGWIRPVSSRRGAIVVTSRDGDRVTWGNWCQLHGLGMLSAADGAQILLDYAGDEAGTREQAQDLALRLGGLPLALRLAGSYLAEARRILLPGSITTFGEYRQALQAEQVSEVFGPPGSALGEAEARDVIDQTWELSLDLLDNRGLSQARELLRLLSMLAAAPIPYEFLLNPAVLADSPLFAEIEVMQLRHLLRALADIGLVDINSAGPDHDLHSLQLHPVLRDVTRHHVRESGQTAVLLKMAARLLHDAIDRNNAEDVYDPETWRLWRTLVPHTAQVVAAVSASTGMPDEVIETAVAAGLIGANYLAATGLYVAAKTECATIVSVCSRTLGAEHPDTLRARAGLAFYTGETGDPAGARDQYAEVLHARERISGTDDPATLGARAGVAQFTGEAGDAAGARDQYAELVPVLERVLGTEHPNTLVARANLARYTGNAGDAAGARDQYAELVPVMERVLGTEHPNTLVARANLALNTGLAGDAAGACNRLATLVPIVERVLGVDHPNTLRARATLAQLTGEAGDAAGARDQYAELVPVMVQVLGAENLSTLTARGNLTFYTGIAGDVTRARYQYAELVPVMERVLGTEHPVTLTARSNQAEFTGGAGDAAGARDCEDRG